MSAEIQKLVNDCASQIGEHCDTVLILATQNESDGEGHFTDGYTGGAGDFYARVGMAMIYLEKNKAVARARAVAGDLHE
jgi:hypothetical protein